MAAIQLSGLVSGFDWKSFVDQMIELERAPITTLESEQTDNTLKTTSLDAVETRLNDLKEASEALNVDGLFTARSATTTSATSWTTSASAGTATGSYTIAVSQLATKASRTGTSDIGQGLSTTSNVSALTLASLPTATAVTAGTFSINGAQVTIALTDSLQDVFDKINTATSGDITASYNAGTDKISLTSGTSTQIVLGAANDTSNFLSVAKLSNNDTATTTSSGALGSVSLNATLTNAKLRTAITGVDSNGAGSFTINGVSISYDVDTDSITSIMKRINDSSAGVAATYDATADRMVLTNKTTGDTGIAISEDAGGVLGALGLTASTLTRGKDTLFTVNGGATRSSHGTTLDATAHGITGLSVTVNSASTDTITVASNSETARDAIDTFISAFNSVQSYISSQTAISQKNGKVTTSTLSDNREVQEWARSLRSLAFKTIGTGTIDRLEKLGIDFSGTDSSLTIKDETKLTNALENDSASVESFFRSSSTGFAAQFNSFFTSVLGITGSGGGLDRQTEQLTKRNTAIDTQIADIERRLVQRRALLESGFIAMETAQSKLKQMQTQLTNSFGSSSSSSSS